MDCNSNLIEAANLDLLGGYSQKTKLQQKAHSKNAGTQKKFWLRKIQETKFTLKKNKTRNKKKFLNCKFPCFIASKPCLDKDFIQL